MLRAGLAKTCPILGYMESSEQFTLQHMHIPTHLMIIFRLYISITQHAYIFARLKDVPWRTYIIFRLYTIPNSYHHS